MTNEKPKAVLFDLDETLIPETRPLANAYRAVAEAILGHAPSDTQVTELRLAARRFWEQHAPCREYWLRVHLGPSDALSSEFSGDGPERAQLREFLPRFRAGVFEAAFPDAAPASDPRRSGLELRELWWEARMGTQTVFDGAHELLEGLRGNHRLAIVTNGASDFQRHKLAETDLSRYFDAIIVAGDLGSGKPHPEPFVAALEALGVTADQAVMIGNDEERDIAGAGALGIRTILTQPGDDPQTGAVTDLSEIPSLL